MIKINWIYRWMVKCTPWTSTPSSSATSCTTETGRTPSFGPELLTGNQNINKCVIALALERYYSTDGKWWKFELEINFEMIFYQLTYSLIDPVPKVSSCQMRRDVPTCLTATSMTKSRSRCRTRKELQIWNGLPSTILVCTTLSATSTFLKILNRRMFR